MDDVEKPMMLSPRSSIFHQQNFKRLKQILNQISKVSVLSPVFYMFVGLYLFINGVNFSKPLNFEWLTDIFIPADCRSQLPDDDEMRQMYRYGANVGFIDFTPWISEFDMNDNKENFWPLIEHYHEVISKL
ncbi:ANM_collapsed_G0054240.mRNA.1.CDS.1 [Saccharomyces cerevisiae]|nr:ANM_collapsed_G0054240.mRNA.1.CDS.1 [Saccharomyces cerevisiae]